MQSWVTARGVKRCHGAVVEALNPLKWLQHPLQTHIPPNKAMVQWLRL